eukprot:366086-Chlamydomonas_euryale.AAC.8
MRSPANETDPGSHPLAFTPPAAPSRAPSPRRATTRLAPCRLVGHRAALGAAAALIEREAQDASLGGFGHEQCVHLAA